MQLDAGAASFRFTPERTIDCALDGFAPARHAIAAGHALEKARLPRVGSGGNGAVGGFHRVYERRVEGSQLG